MKKTYSGRCRYSIKYDMGGIIPEYRNFITILQEEFQLTEFENSLSEFNLSFLSTIEPIYQGVYSQYSPDGWDGQMIIQENGILTFIINSPTITCNSKSDLVEQLLAQYEYFVREKNKDYIYYLSRSGSLTKSLSKYKSRIDVADKENPLLHTGSVASHIRELTKTSRDLCDCYYFHDYRTTFFIEDIQQFSDEEIQPMLHLSEDSLLPDTQREAKIKPAGKIPKINLNTWSFVADMSLYQSDKFSIVFQIAHSNWYKTQAWIFKLRGLMNQRILERDIENLALNKIEGEASKLINLKSIIFTDLFSIHNTDLVLKSAHLNDSLEAIKKSFKISKQIDIINLQLLHIEELIKNLKVAVNSKIQKRNAKSQRAIEMLFAISAFCALGTFLPDLMATDVHPDLTWETIDLPRRISLLLFILAFGTYFLLNAIKSQQK